jgi:SAM-dependent methyltransferase
VLTRVDSIKIEEIQHATKERYAARYREHGYSPLTLGWNKGKQFERFHQLTSDWDMNGRSVLDVGCGFGDFLHYADRMGVKGLDYTGIDITPELICEARKIHGVDGASFVLGGIEDHPFDRRFDYAFASGIFNYKYEGVDRYERLFQIVSHMFDLANIAVAVDMLSDKVDYELEHTWHYNPGETLERCYGLTRNVVLKNSYFPFEFAVILYKDDSFDAKDTMFTYARRLGFS